MNSAGSNFSVITMNQSNVSQATVISKRSVKSRDLIVIHQLTTNNLFSFSIQASYVLFRASAQTIYTETSWQRCEIRRSMRS